MYHELILALSGFTGDVFEFDGKCIKTRSDLQIPLLHPSELAIVNGILEIATYYKLLDGFVETQQELSLSIIRPEKSSSAGIYVSSVCNGIRELLRDYCSVVALIELRVLDDPYLTLNHIRVQLEPFRSLFQTLFSLVSKIQAHNRSSTVIVEIVKSEFDANIQLQDPLRKLIPWVNRTLYKQITNWVVFGTLADPNGEFFIQKRVTDLELEATNTSKEKPEHVSKVTQKHLVNYSLVPSHFSVPLTERILFIGHSITILEHSEKTKAFVMEKQKLFCEQMKKLATDTFRTEDLSDTIEEIATSVGKELHHLVVTETDLPKHLGIVKDFYLTGRGELFHDFLLNLKQSSRSKNSVISDIRNAFTLSAARVQVQEDVLQRITISIPHDADRSSLSNCISHISLRMEHEWPLEVLFTEEAIQRYNELFRFLLQVRLLQLELNTIWVNTKKIFRFPVPRGPAELKNIMSYFIDHLQHYLQEDVLENQYAILLAAVEKSENFDQIRVAHATFQSNILLQSFRTIKRVRHFVEQITNVCSNYVNFMNSHIELCESRKLPINEGISKEISEFSSDFRKHMELLLSLLKGLAVNPQSGQHLGQFLLRLDFNSYFSSTISGLSLST